MSVGIWKGVLQWIGNPTEVSLGEFMAYFHNCEKVMCKSKKDNYYCNLVSNDVESLALA